MAEKPTKEKNQTDYCNHLHLAVVWSICFSCFVLLFLLNTTLHNFTLKNYGKCLERQRKGYIWTSSCGNRLWGKKESEEETDEEELGILDWVFSGHSQTCTRGTLKPSSFFPPFCFLHSHPHSHLDNSPLIISGSSAHPPSFTSLMHPHPRSTPSSHLIRQASTSPLGCPNPLAPVLSHWPVLSPSHRALCLYLPGSLTAPLPLPPERRPPAHPERCCGNSAPPTPHPPPPHHHHQSNLPWNQH